MGKKLDSLLKLSSMGLNTPVFDVIETAEEVSKFVKKMEGWGKVSVRTDTKESNKNVFKLPFYPNQPWHLAVHSAGRILKNPEHIVIISKGIDPRRSLAAGKYYKTKTSERIEFFLGPGTIREKMEGSLKETELYDVNLFGSRPFPLADPKCPIEFIVHTPEIQRMRKDAEGIAPPFLLEWSIYAGKIGKKQQRRIYWEIIQ